MELGVNEIETLFTNDLDRGPFIAETLREHNRNVNKWQKIYWRKKWAEERRRKRAQ